MVTTIEAAAAARLRLNDFARSRWWEQPAVLFAIALLSAVPLLWPEVPPLVDLPGHIGRYRVELDLGSSPHLKHFYEYRWALIGNLGVDLLILPLAPVLGLEQSVKLIVLLIPPLTVAGIFAVARQVHDGIPATALFAVPLVYSYPFTYGFINFALSMALALLAFALWLRLTREERFGTRALLFLPLSCLLWIVHAFGWGVLGLLAFAAELARLRAQLGTWRSAAPRAALQMLPLAPPLALMMIWRAGAVAGETGGVFSPVWKLYALVAALRDRWLVWDSLGVAVLLVLIGTALMDKRFAVSRRLAAPAVVIALAFLALPYKLFGSAYADVRLAPYAMLIAILAIRVRPGHAALESSLAAAGAAFLLLRLAGNALSFGMAHAETQEKLQALTNIPPGAAVLTLTAGECGREWKLPRNWHLGGLLIARKHAFTNDQWELAGAQLLKVRYTPAAPFDNSDSLFIYSRKCLARMSGNNARGLPMRSTSEAFTQFPRDAFDYVWIIEMPEPKISAPPDLAVVWRGGDSILYRVARPGAARGQPR